ncbi:uncharacterized protein HD556DRAFT_1306341 [Suillus plorans]|uniref:Uncharacterized protein n=1 Tax=Suillus plorans TaxID=116603 RepID=A0A9P7DLC2_9AGAM|nr:uncharacterized protein HD556DRAFT_1306341 [Suillus plorans]KAG1797717.1 hypothetical protein HD556DRAFT_1306341 [Suillus plorans]
MWNLFRMRRVTIDHLAAHNMGPTSQFPAYSVCLQGPSLRGVVPDGLYDMRSSSDTSLRLPIYTALLKVPANNGELETLCLCRSDVEQWLQEWDISGEERSQFLKSIVDAFIQSDQPETAYHYTLSYVSSLPSSSPSPAIDAIALALRLPSLFDFDPLFKSDAVVSAKDHELFSLLQVFLNTIPLLSKNMNSARAEDPSPVICVTGFFTRRGRPALFRGRVDPAGLLSGKLSQTTPSLHVYRSSARTFEREK